jgi:hypothetical protein
MTVLMQCRRGRQIISRAAPLSADCDVSHLFRNINSRMGCMPGISQECYNMLASWFSDPCSVSRRSAATQMSCQGFLRPWIRQVCCKAAVISALCTALERPRSVSCLVRSERVMLARVLITLKSVRAWFVIELDCNAKLILCSCAASPLRQ